ncbi:AB hydrolase superfamily protein B1A11.02 [Cyphellophora attinorum]|uniref:AB hydrolase superfamily protein B1A11.02 n=1 Tax=Cyphellophora attinorum TaxID=1664694 RepID=A0A0N1H5I7_9EURO|nr:AB hydrolase superfamily protein B1A11.02 [Phialophora attinorum]KPI37666.1 AB hydrolase superfamily protein B1A11.02 [Phialophora attinorum]
MADYSEYGIPSAEWLALEPNIPPLPAFSSVDELKQITNGGREKVSAEEMISQGLSEVVALTDHSIPTRDGSTVEARSYRPKTLPSSGPLPVYVHLHGGGFLFGTLSSEDAGCSRIVKSFLEQYNQGIVVLNVNYRHTPEFTFPTAWEDVEDALVWLHGIPEAELERTLGVGIDRSRVVVGGISAGGQLSASASLKQNLGLGPTAKLPKLKGQVLMIPALVHLDHQENIRKQLKSPEASSYHTQSNAPILDLKRIKLFTDQLKVSDAVLKGEGFANDRRLNIGNATPDEVKGLPATVFGIAGSDPLRDEGLFFAKLLADQGVPTNVQVFPGHPHGGRRYGNQLPIASKAWDACIVEGIHWILSEPAAAAFDIKKAY